MSSSFKYTRLPTSSGHTAPEFRASDGPSYFSYGGYDSSRYNSSFSYLNLGEETESKADHEPGRVSSTHLSVKVTAL